MIFTVLTILCLFIISLVFCQNIEKNIETSSSFIQILNRNNYVLSLSYFYAVEKFCEENNAGLNIEFPNMIFILDADEEIFNIMQEYNENKDEILNRKYNPYLSDSIYTILFRIISNDTSGYNRFGLKSGIDNILLESNYGEYDANSAVIYANIGYQMIEYNENIRLIVDNDFKNNLNDIFNTILIATIVYIIFSILLYFCIYLPHLNAQSQQLQAIQSLVTLIPVTKGR